MNPFLVLIGIGIAGLGALMPDDKKRITKNAKPKVVPTTSDETIKSTNSIIDDTRRGDSSADSVRTEETPINTIDAEIKKDDG